MGTVEGDLVTPHPTWAPKLSESVPTTLALPPGPVTVASAPFFFFFFAAAPATITEIPDPTNPGAAMRTVTYKQCSVNEDGLILERGRQSPTPARTASATADITVTGTQVRYLRG